MPLANGDPVSLLDAIEAHADRFEGLRIHQMHVIHDRRYLHGLFGNRMRHVSYVLSAVTRPCYREGTIDLVPSNFSEMRDVLKPGGILVIEDGDLASAMSIPATALNAFADLFMRLGPVRGVNYSIANDLYHMVKKAGFPAPQMEIHQPAGCRDENGVLLRWSVAEAGPAFVGAGLVTSSELQRTLNQMEEAADDPDVLVLSPRMSVVWARKPRGTVQALTGTLPLSNI